MAYRLEWLFQILFVGWLVLLLLVSGNLFAQTRPELSPKPAATKIQKPSLPKKPQIKKPKIEKPTLSAEKLGLKPDSGKKSFLQSKGTAQFSTQHSSVQGDNQQVAPPNHLRFLFNTTLTVGVLPILMSGFFTTEQSPLRQNMNYFSVNVNYEELQKNVRQKVQEKFERMKKEGLENVDSLYKKQQDSLVKTEYEKEFKRVSLPDRNKIVQEYKAKVQRKAEEQLQKYRDSLAVQEKIRSKWQHRADSSRQKWQDFDPDTDTLDESKRKALDKKQAVEDSLVKYEQKMKKAKDKYQQVLARYEQTKNLKLNEDSLKRIVTEKYGKQWQARLERKKDSLEQKLSEKKEKYEKLKALRKMKSGEFGTKGKELDSLGLISRWEKVLMNFKSVNIGTSFPYYSDYTLNRVPITGLNIEYAPKRFYLSATGSKNLQAVNGTANTSLINSAQGILRSAYARDLFATAVGIGRQENDHLHLNFIYGLDHEASLEPDSITRQRLKPRENWLFGTDFSYKLPKKILPVQISGEITASLISKDVQQLRLNGSEIGSWLPQPIQETDQKAADLATRLTANWQVDSLSLIKADFQRVGTGFYSLGVPFLRNDFQNIQAEIRRQFWKKQISASIFGLEDRTNLSGRKAVGLHTFGGGAGLGLSFKGLPTLIGRYMRTITFQNEQQKDAPDTNFVLSTMDNAMLTLTHGFSTGSVKHQSTLTGTGQWVSSPNPTLAVKVYGLQYVHAFIFPIPVVLAVNGGFTAERRYYLSFNLWTLGVQGSYTWRTLTATLTGATSIHSAAGSKSITSFQLKMPVGQYLDLQAKAEYQYFQLSGGGFGNTIVTSGVGVRW